MDGLKSATIVRAINHYGVDSQVDKAVEEMGELIVELARRRSERFDRDRTAEEIADVLIMVSQLRVIYGGEDVDRHIEEKLARLERRMNGPWRRQEREYRAFARKEG